MVITLLIWAGKWHSEIHSLRFFEEKRRPSSGQSIHNGCWSNFLSLGEEAPYRAARKWVKVFAGYNQGKREGNLIPKKENVAKKHHYSRNNLNACFDPSTSSPTKVHAGNNSCNAATAMVLAPATTARATRPFTRLVMENAIAWSEFYRKQDVPHRR
jgi:hypothetical protein